MGKTTLGATLGVAAARSGLDVLLVQTQGSLDRGGSGSIDPIARLFGCEPLGYAPRELMPVAPGRLRGCSLGADAALIEYLEHNGLDRLTRLALPAAGRPALELLTAAIPGIRDLLLLGKIRQLESTGAAELIIVDAPSSGHAVTFLRSAVGLSETDSGPIRDQARLAADFLIDADRCQVALVTLAEETPVTETIETAFAIEDELGVKLAPILVNARWPELAGLAEAARHGDRRRRRVRDRQTAADFRLRRIAAEQAEVERLAVELPLPQLHFPHLGLLHPNFLDRAFEPGSEPGAVVNALAGYAEPRLLNQRSIILGENAAPTAPSTPARRSAPVHQVGLSLPETEVIFCLGPGGVGKTTTAAALAMSAAATGARVALITVDPARRLADALGLDHLGHLPERLDGEWSGELSACMLDTQQSFERVIREYATTQQADRIIGHRLFRHLTTSLSGTHEYLAIDQLWHLHQSSDHYDLVVVDTPPAQNAVDLLDSAARLVRFVDHPVYRGVLSPTGRFGRVTALAARSAAALVGRLIGIGLIEEVADFFRAFGELDAGFRVRAADMDALLRSSKVAYVLTSTPQPESLAQIAALTAKLPPSTGQRRLLVNRCTPRFDSPAEDQNPDPAEANLCEFQQRANAENDHLGLHLQRNGLAVLALIDERPEPVASTSAVWQLAQSDLGGVFERL